MRGFARSLFAATAFASQFGCSAPHEVDESAKSVPAAFVAATRAEGIQSALPRFTDEGECARLKQMLMPRIRRSFAQEDAQFRKEVLGRDMALEEIESLTPRAFFKAFLWRVQTSGTAVQPPEILSASSDGSIVTLLVRTRFIDPEGKPMERDERMQLRESREGYKMLLNPDLEAFANVLIAR